jgi:hypothetical protein
VKTKYIFISIPILLVLLYIAHTWRKDDLINTGTRTQGQVTEVSKISFLDNLRSKRRIEYYEVRILFTADGERITGVKEVQPTEINKRKIIKGDMVYIIYDRKDPNEFILCD